MNFKENSLQICDAYTLEPITDFDGIGNVTVESEIETSSLSKEKISFNHEASFECELDCSPLLNQITDYYNKPYYVEYYIPIMIQARWHKKKRINKKWLKRYGMKKDKILVRCDVDSFGQEEALDPYDFNDFKSEVVQYNVTPSNMQWKFRPDQLRRNLKIEECYD